MSGFLCVCLCLSVFVLVFLYLSLGWPSYRSQSWRSSTALQKNQGICVCIPVFVYFKIFCIMYLENIFLAFTWGSPSWSLIWLQAIQSQRITISMQFWLLSYKICITIILKTILLFFERRISMFWNILILHNPNDHKLWFITYKESNYPSSHNRGGKQSRLVKLILINFRFYIMHCFFSQCHNNI